MDKQTIKSWFTRGKKPTQAQFWTVFDSYRHIDDRLTMSDIEGLMMALATKSNEGHTHTLAEITDYQSQEKEVINSRVAANQDELDEMDLVDGMKYILLSDEKLYVCTYNEDTEELELNEDTPSPDVIYSAEDAAHDMKIYLYNAATLLFQDVTGQEVDKTIYTPDLDSLITRQLNNGIYSVVHINSGDDNNTYGDAYTLTVGDGSIACRILECRTGWAQAQLVDDSYQWKWHRYSYEGHTHEMNTISGLIEALAGKAAVAHNHVLTDITGLADALAGKAASVHTHAMSAITGLADALSAKANTIHQHDMAQVTGLSTALAGKSDTGHGHQMSSVEGLTDALSGKAPTTHEHAMSNVQGLTTALAGKADTQHTHNMEQINGLVSAMAGKAASSHQHIMADITGLNDALNGKAGTNHTHPIDSALSDSSNNPVKNKVVKTAIDWLTAKYQELVAAIDELLFLKPITYAELKELRDNGELRPGRRYRITDYLTTIGNDSEARSAEHPFDLIVLALSNDTLAEEAHAIRSARDTDGYFDNAKLNAWKVWYCLDNDQTRFAFADTDESQHIDLAENGRYERYEDGDQTIDDVVYYCYCYCDGGDLDTGDTLYITDEVPTMDSTIYNLDETDCHPDEDTIIGVKAGAGTGVIYRMIDEWGNDCPYDFKNVQFKRYKVEDDSPNGELADLDGKYIGYNGYMQGLIISDMSDFVWCYTFCEFDDIYDSEPSGIRDGSLKRMQNAEADWYNGQQNGCVLNKINVATSVLDIDGESNVVQALNNIVCCTFDPENEKQENYANIFGVQNTNVTVIGGDTNVFGTRCTNNILSQSYKNTFGNGCSSNTFGNYCNYNTFGNGCYYNTFGNDCYENTFGNCFQCNTFGNGCSSNTFGNYCNYNTFGNSFRYNTFGNECYNNTFGNDCWYNTFGNYCTYNTFGNDCWYNTFGNDCYYNTFGNDCGGNTFGNSFQCNTFGNYCRTLTIFDGVQYVSVTGGSSDSDYVQNAQILNGTCGSGSDDLLEISFDENANYTQMAGLNSDGELRVWTPADMV
ncbi:MAG: phage tail repeat domain-containing protein [Paludibacteraceae bacterium]|nr:phage tail repeat domain-containing protein [Paludibacteraceae bacterium]